MHYKNVPKYKINKPNSFYLPHTATISMTGYWYMYWSITLTVEVDVANFYLKHFLNVFSS